MRKTSVTTFYDYTYKVTDLVRRNNFLKMKYLQSINSSEDYIYVMFRFDLLYLQLQPISFSLLFDSSLPPQQRLNNRYEKASISDICNVCDPILHREHRQLALHAKISRAKVTSALSYSRLYDIMFYK